MSINDIGKEGERLARQILKERGCSDIFQADWLVKFPGSDDWIVVEVKHKERFRAPPYDGHGLNAYQADMRLKFQKETGIRTLFLVIGADDNRVYIQWLDALHKKTIERYGQLFETKNGIRIFDLRFFKIAGMQTPTNNFTQPPTLSAGGFSYAQIR